MVGAAIHDVKRNVAKIGSVKMLVLSNQTYEARPESGKIISVNILIHAQRNITTMSNVNISWVLFTNLSTHTAYRQTSHRGGKI